MSCAIFEGSKSIILEPAFVVFSAVTLLLESASLVFSAITLFLESTFLVSSAVTLFLESVEPFDVQGLLLEFLNFVKKSELA